MKLGREVKNRHRKACLIQRKWKCRGLATLVSAVKEIRERRKEVKIKSYLQKTLKAYGDRIKGTVVYTMKILPGMRKKNCPESSTCI